jgi:hypothetical protein
MKKAGANSTNVTVGGGKYGTIPPGYELNEGPTGATMRPIPGGPAAAEVDAANDKKNAAAAQAGTYADIVTQDIDRAKQRIQSAKIPVTGLGSMLAPIPGSSAHDVASLISTVRANVGFDRLQQMRAASPTGGALGAVSDYENQLMQATVGALEQSQSQDQLLYNLDRVQKIYRAIMTTGIKPGDPIASGLDTAQQPGVSNHIIDFSTYFGGQ